MRVLAAVMLALVIVQVVLAGITAFAGSFADGGDELSWLLLVVVHPVGAVGLLLLALAPRLPATVVLLLCGILLVNVAADLYVALLINRGEIQGDAGLPLVFGIIPAIGIVYFLILRFSRPQGKPA